MKRFLILILSLLLLVGAIACGGRDKPAEEQPKPAAETASAPAEQPAGNPAAPAEQQPNAPAPAFAAGEYALQAYRVGDVALEGERMTASGITGTLTLNADRTGLLVMTGQEIPFEWTDDGSVLFAGTPYYSMASAEDGTIEFSMGDAVMVFRFANGSAPVAVEVPATEAPVVTEAPVATEAPVVTEAPAVSDGEFPGAPYGDSDGKVDRATLAGLYRWMRELPSAFLYALTFDEIGAAAGKQGRDSRNNDGKTHSATWSDDQNDIVTVTFKKQNDDTWACSAITISGIRSDEYNAADVSGFPKIASSTPAGTNATEAATFTVKVGFSGPKVDVTAQVPVKNWYPNARSSTLYIYCNPRAEKADYSQSYIKIECKESLEKIDFYKDKFENLSELAPRTIGGIEMQGRSYRDVGMDWIEYYGEIAEGVWVSIKLTGVDFSAGTETEALVLGLAFAKQ